MKGNKKRMLYIFLIAKSKVKGVLFHPPFKNVNSFNCPDILSEIAP